MASFSGYLTSKQRGELHAGILGYLSENESFSETAAAFRREAELDAVESAEKKGILVKKWTSVVRLSKQVQDLQKRADAAESIVKTARLQDEGGEVGSAADACAVGTISREKRVASLIPSNQPHILSLTGHRDSVTCVRAHPTYGLVASCSKDAMIKVWDAETGKLDRTLRGHTKAVTNIAFDPRGISLASCSLDLTIKIWNIEQFSCTRTLSGHDHTISGLVFHPAGDQLVSCSRDATVKFWELETGYCRSTTNSTDWLRCIDVSADGQFVATAGNAQVVVILDASTGEVTHELRGGHEHFIQCLRFSTKAVSPEALGLPVEDFASTAEPSGVILLASGARDSTVSVWNVAVGDLLFQVRDHTNWVNDLAFTSDGKYIVTCSDDRSVKVTDVVKRRRVRDLVNAHGHFVTSLALMPSIGRVASGGADKDIRLWDCC